MYKYLPITDVYAREILDSRGNPTIEVEVLAGDEFCGRASVPSGASTGKYEAVELRDKEERYGGLGVQQAADHVNARIAPEVIGMNVLDQTLISGCRIFHFGSLSLTDEPAESTTIEAVKMAKAAGALISYDPNYRPSLWKSKEDAVKKMRSVIELVDVMKVSDEESTLLTEAKSYEQAADQLLAMGPKLVAITLGEQGVLMATKSRKEIIKAFQIHAVDTTGAGDSFWGGVLCSILSMNKNVEKMEWEEIKKCAVLGNAVAGLCVQKRGGIPAIPTKEAVFEFMQK